MVLFADMKMSMSKHMKDIEDSSLAAEENWKLAHSREVQIRQDLESTHFREKESCKSSNDCLKKELDQMGVKFSLQLLNNEAWHRKVDNLWKELEEIKSGEKNLKKVLDENLLQGKHQQLSGENSTLQMENKSIIERIKKNQEQAKLREVQSDQESKAHSTVIKHLQDELTRRDSHVSKNPPKPMKKDATIGLDRSHKTCT